MAASDWGGGDAWGGKPLVSKKDYTKGTEYGGVEGLIQPLPHQSDLDSRGSRETLMKIYNSHAGGIRAEDNSTIADADDEVPETLFIRGYLD